MLCGGKILGVGALILLFSNAVVAKDICGLLVFIYVSYFDLFLWIRIKFVAKHNDCGL